MIGATHTFGKLDALRSISLIALVASTVACASAPTQAPARLASTQPETLARLTVVLQQAMGTQRIVFGPEVLATSTSISVLPPPLGEMETRSLALPEVFDIVKRGNSCLLIRRTTGTAYALGNIRCVGVASLK